jgi:hypothetical protein
LRAFVDDLVALSMELRPSPVHNRAV